MFSLLLSKCLLALSLYMAKNWIIAQGFSIVYLNALVLLSGGIGLGIWEKLWDKPRASGKRKEVSCYSPLLEFDCNWIRRFKKLREVTFIFSPSKGERNVEGDVSRCRLCLSSVQLQLIRCRMEANSLFVCFVFCLLFFFPSLS